MDREGVAAAVKTDSLPAAHGGDVEQLLAGGLHCSGNRFLVGYELELWHVGVARRRADERGSELEQLVPELRDGVVGTRVTRELLARWNMGLLLR